MESDGDEKRAVIGYTKTRAAEVLEHLRAEASVQTEKLAAEQKRSEEELACQLIESEKNRVRELVLQISSKGFDDTSEDECVFVLNSIGCSAVKDAPKRWTIATGHSHEFVYDVESLRRVTKLIVQTWKGDQKDFDAGAGPALQSYSEPPQLTDKEIEVHTMLNRVCAQGKAVWSSDLCREILDALAIKCELTGSEHWVIEETGGAKIHAYGSAQLRDKTMGKILEWGTLHKLQIGAQLG